MNLFSHSWLPFIYLYGLGGILFIAGIIITMKAGSFDLKRPKHKKWMWILIFGFFWYFIMHALMTWAALGTISPYVVLYTLLGLVGVFIVVTLRFGKGARA